MALSLFLTLTPHKQVQASLSKLLRAIDFAISLNEHQDGHHTGTNHDHYSGVEKMAPLFETDIVPGILPAPESADLIFVQGSESAAPASAAEEAFRV